MGDSPSTAASEARGLLGTLSIRRKLTLISMASTLVGLSLTGLVFAGGLLGAEARELDRSWWSHLAITALILLLAGAVAYALTVRLQRLVLETIETQNRELVESNWQLEQRVMKRTRELVEAKDRAEAADRVKSLFLATMSHELRTPLNSIIGFTGILLQGLGGPINEEQRKQLSMVKGSAHHLLTLISDVLDISKIEAGQLTVSREPFDLRASVGKVVQTVRPLADRQGIDLREEISDGISACTGDARRVEQVLLNLLSNAVKFTERGSVRVRCEEHPEGFAITVTDTGIGIAEGDLHRLFEPFRQLDTGLSRKYEGTGLGLSISRKLVELMGGCIWVESEKGKGSRFGFTLPPGGEAA